MQKLIKVLIVALIVTGLGYLLVTQPQDKETTKTVVAPTVPTSVPAPTEYAIKKINNIVASPEQVLYLDTPITEETVSVAISLLTIMTASYKDVYILINSPGGGVLSGQKLISYIEGSPIHIHTVCVAICASMAAHIHQSGYDRLIEESGVLMFHPAAGGVSGQVENMLNQVNVFKKIVDSLDAKAAYRSGGAFNEFKQRVAFEYWVPGFDAVQQKLADRLVYINTKDAAHSRGIPVSQFAKQLIHIENKTHYPLLDLNN